MRKAPSALLLSVLVPMAGAVPVITPVQAAPRPVAPQVRSAALTGVDLGASRGTVRRSFAAADQARGAAAASDRGRPAGPPEVFVTRTGVASFDLVGVTWKAPAAKARESKLGVLIRTHSGSGWSEWTALDLAPPPAATEGATRPGTEPLWTGPSDGYQVRVDVRSGPRPRGLRIDLIDPGASPADAHPQGSRPLQSADAAAAQPQIFTRAQWGADENLRRGTPSYNATIRAGFVHHTAGSNGYSQSDVPKILRAIYAYHVKGNGWSDIGYNFLVDRFGRLWEGRYGGMDRAVVGAHTGGFNVDSFAVSAIGNYDKAAAPSVMVDSIARVLAWKLGQNFRDPNGRTTLTSQGGGTSRYSAGTRVSVNVISGHRDMGKTSCPGGNLYAQLATIRALTTSYIGTTMYDPSLSSTTAVYGTGASITATARPNTDQQWRVEVREVCRATLVRTITGTSSPSLPVSALWDLRDDSGAEVRPGAYTLSLVGADANASTNTWTTTVTVNAARTLPTSSGAAALPGRTGFVAVDPIRLYDTRSDANLPLAPRQRIDLRVPGVGKLPESGIAAVALNISTSCSTASTAIKVWAAGSRLPSTAALNVAAGTNASAMTVTALGGNGAISLRNRSGTTELAVHVVGYYPTEGGDVFRPSKTLRLYDSRRDGGRLPAGGDRTITVPTLARVPAASMTGALLNVTAFGAAGAGAITVQSNSSTRDSASVSFAPGRNVKNRAVAKLEDGTFKVTNTGAAAAHVVVDLVGWWAPAEVVRGRLFQPKSLTRVLDTRKGIGAKKAKVASGKAIRVRVAGKRRPIPGSAKAVVMTLTARSATRSTFVTAWPNGKRRPAFPDLSVPAWRTTANLVVVRIGKKNRIKLTNGSGSTHLVGDVVGYYP